MGNLRTHRQLPSPTSGIPDPKSYSKASRNAATPNFLNPRKPLNPLSLGPLQNPVEAWLKPIRSRTEASKDS